MEEQLTFKKYSELEDVESSDGLDLISLNADGNLVKLPSSIFSTGNVKPLIIIYNNNTSGGGNVM